MRKIIVMVALTVAAVIGVAAPASAADLPPAPSLGKPVVDNANILSDKDEYTVATEINLIRSETGHELAVLTTPDMGGATIEDYSLAVANKWGVGSAKANDGIVLVIAMKERKIRLEVGSGLSNQVSDSVAGDIVDNIISPKLHDGDYVGGIVSGFKQLDNIFQGKSTDANPPVVQETAAQKAADKAQQDQVNLVGIIVISSIGGILVIVVTIVLIVYFVRRARDKREQAEADAREEERRVARAAYLKTPAGQAQLKKEREIEEQQRKLAAERSAKQREAAKAAKDFYDSLTPEQVRSITQAKKNDRHKLLQQELASARSTGSYTSAVNDNSILTAILLYSVFAANDYSSSSSSHSSSSSSSSYDYNSSSSSYGSSFDSGSFGGGGFDGGGASGGF